jgi:LPS sulfotransferase NodH
MTKLEKLRQSLAARLEMSSTTQVQAETLLQYICDTLTVSDELQQAAVVARAREMAAWKASENLPDATATLNVDTLGGATTASVSSHHNCNLC